VKEDEETNDYVVRNKKHS